MKHSIGLFILLTLVTGQGLAGQYAIQLEASRSSSLERFESLRSYGDLYTETADSGYIRKRLGPYNNRAEALNVLKQVHAAGFTDAILTSQKGTSHATASSPVNTASRMQVIENLDVKTLKEWKLLTPEQQKNLVYLDGKLHIKDGDAFTPLADVVGGK